MVSQEIIDKLNHVTVPKKNVNLAKFPNFFIAGPHRCGSTWLYKNLRRHPQIFMTRPKGIDYFIFLKEPEHELYASSDLDYYVNYFSDTLYSYTLKMAHSLIHFREFYNPKIRGEGSTTSAVLHKDVKSDVITLNPDIKLIFMIRNPIERAWSNAKRILMREADREFEEVPHQEFVDFFNDPYMKSCGFFTTIFDNWGKLVPEKNIFIGQFEDMKRNPEKLLLNIFTFLGVKSNRKYIPEISKKKFNVTKSIKVPERYHELLYDMYRDEIKRLHERFDLSWKVEVEEKVEV